MIILSLSILLMGCCIAIAYLLNEVNVLRSDLHEHESKARFWEKQYKGTNND
jgi:hypothetical protein